MKYLMGVDFHGNYRIYKQWDDGATESISGIISLQGMKALRKGLDESIRIESL